MHVPCIIHIGALIHPFLGKMMGTNQTGKRFYQVKIKGLDVTSLKELGQLMGQLQRQAFRKAYGKIWDLAMVSFPLEDILESPRILQQSVLFESPQT